MYTKIWMCMEREKIDFVHVNPKRRNKKRRREVKLDKMRVFSCECLQGVKSARIQWRGSKSQFIWLLHVSALGSWHELKDLGGDLPMLHWTILGKKPWFLLFVIQHCNKSTLHECERSKKLLWNIPENPSTSIAKPSVSHTSQNFNSKL